MNGFTAIHLAIAGLCALMAVLHLAMWLAVRSEPAHKWVALSFLGFLTLDLGLAGSSIASGHTLGDVRPWLLLTTPTALLLPPALIRTAWAVLDWPMTPFRRRLLIVQVALVVPVATQFTWMVLSGAPEATSWEEARYAYPLTAIPYNIAILLVGAVWIVESIRALSTMRLVALTALGAMVPSLGFTVREAFIAMGTLQGPTLVGVTALPLGAFASVSLVVRYVRVMRQQSEPSPAATEQYQRMVRLGAGGMGELWLALRSGEAGFQRWVVIKRIRMDRLDDHLVDRFLVEARVAARLHHANVVSVYDLGHYDDGWFIVMEYLSGPSLWEVMTRCYEEERFAPLSAVAQIGVDVCRGLESAHGHGVLHRDISPDNVIVTFDGVAKILDFGIAKEAGMDEPALTGPMSDDGRHTAAGGVVGKAQYLAPERTVGEPASVESDLYALGLVLVQLMGAPIPERGADLAGHPQPVSEYRPDAPEAIEEIIRKALSPHPKQRYRSASAMAADLMMVIAIDGPIDLSAWVRDLCPARYALQRKLSELRDPTPASVGDLFAEMMGAGSRHDTQEGPRAPEETTDRPQAPSTVRIGISL